MNLRLTLAALGPAACLALAVVYSRASGNDKAPLLVLMVLALNALLAFGLLVQAVIARTPQTWRCAGLAALPLAYAGAVLVLARQGWLDSEWLLGIR